MKKLLLLFILSGSLLRAQTPYVKMLGTTTDWYIFQDYIPISSSNKTMAPTIYMPNWGKCSAYTDTLVMGKTYKKFYHVYVYPSPGPGTHVGYLREDSAARKVYYLDKMNTMEDIIYDFSLSVGDSVFYNFPSFTGNFPKGYYKLKSITTVTTPLGLRNQYNLIYKNGITVSDTLKQIEGIGSVIHPIYMNNSSYGMGQFSYASTGCKYPYDLGLACKFTDFQKVYQSCTYVTALGNGCIFKYDSCNYWNTCSGINELSLVRNLDISPNPASYQCDILLELADHVDATVEIYNVVGQKLKGETYTGLNPGSHKISMDINSFANGLYYIRVRGIGFEMNKPLVIEH